MIYLIDLFCGAGGVTTGIEQAEINNEKIAKVIACVNHDIKAIESHESNHPGAVHYTEDIRTLELSGLTKQVLKIRNSDPDAIIALWASLECTNFSKAKGGLPRDGDSRTLAHHLYRYIDAVNPQYVLIENVEEFMSWGPLDENGKPESKDKGSDYVKWCNHIQNMGFSFDWKLINSADHGAFTSRKRFFAIFASHGMPVTWPVPTHSKKPNKGGMFGDLKPWKAVREVLDLEDHGKTIFGRKKDLSEKTLSRIYAGLIKYVAGGKDAFLLKYNSINKETGKHVPPSIDEPCPVIAAQGRLGVMNVNFITKYYSGKPEGKSIPISGPAGTITCTDGQALNTVKFFTNYHGKLEDSKSLDGPAGTVTTKDDCNLITAQFINRDFTSGGESSSIDKPAGSVMPSPKMNLVTAHYLVNPQWNGNGGSLDGPCCTIIARQDKAPLYLIEVLEGGYNIPVYEGDSEMTVKIKQFMAIYGIADILMRMLKVDELLRIQGFPNGYVLIGNQADQKKFIGNSVVPVIPKRMMEALAMNLKNNNYKMEVA